ncbi:hypothetical protein CGCF413_v004230 [Colletotrichum fructicola]|nr:hypothetical protein CGCF413_v004230 [Colletotrichum fructicola]
MFHDQQHRSTNKLNYSQAPNQQAATTGSAENCTRAVFPVAPAVSTLPPTLTLLRVTTRQRISTFGHQKSEIQLKSEQLQDVQRIYGCFSTQSGPRFERELKLFARRSLDEGGATDIERKGPYP